MELVQETDPTSYKRYYETLFSVTLHHFAFILRQEYAELYWGHFRVICWLKEHRDLLFWGLIFQAVVFLEGKNREVAFSVINS